jgi:hypothetical protein
MYGRFFVFSIKGAALVRAAPLVPFIRDELNRGNHADSNKTVETCTFGSANSLPSRGRSRSQLATRRAQHEQDAGGEQSEAQTRAEEKATTSEDEEAGRANRFAISKSTSRNDAGNADANCSTIG